MLATLLTQYNPDGSVIPLGAITSVRDQYGRRPFVYVEIDMDFCANVYGVAPCTASIDVDNPQKCYNTLISCQDRPNFARGVKTYRFSDQNQQVPEGLDAIPCLQGISLTPAKIDTGNGLGLRSGASATFIDFPHSDIRIDPYVSERPYIPLANGTFWGKFRSRNPYYNGRVMRIYSGYLDAAGKYDLDLFERRTFFIEEFDGVSARGTVTIKAKDVLKLANDDRAVFPRPSVGKLTLDLDETDTTVTITPVGVGNLDYPASGFVRIGSEVCAFTRTGDDLTLNRGEGGTDASSHSVGDTVQLCAWFDGETVQDIVFDLITIGARISPTYINKSDWDAEQAAYLPRLYSALITAPTGVSKLIAELAEQVGFFMFWDEVAERIIFKSIRPNSGTDTIYDLTADSNILADSLDIKDLVNERLNEVWVYYGIIDTTKNLTEASNYKVVQVSSNPADQSEIQSNDLRIKKIFSRWISEFNGSAATELANRYILRYTRAPRQVALKLDAKDAQVTLADFVRVTSPQNQTFSGASQSLLLQVIQRTESQQGTTYNITAREFAYDDTDFDQGIINIPISVNAEYIDLRAFYDSILSGDPSGKTVNFVVQAGVTIAAETNYLDFGEFPAIYIGQWPSNTILTLTNNGMIYGAGGLGASRDFIFNNKATDGFPAISASRIEILPFEVIVSTNFITITNNGTIGAGGGGGGAGGFESSGGQGGYTAGDVLGLNGVYGGGRGGDVGQDGQAGSSTDPHPDGGTWGDAGSAGVLIDMPETQFIFTNNGVVIGS